MLSIADGKWNETTVSMATATRNSSQVLQVADFSSTTNSVQWNVTLISDRIITTTTIATSCSSVCRHTHAQSPVLCSPTIGNPLDVVDCQSIHFIRLSAVCSVRVRMRSWLSWISYRKLIFLTKYDEIIRVNIQPCNSAAQNLQGINKTSEVN